MTYNELVALVEKHFPQGFLGQEDGRYVIYTFLRLIPDDPDADDKPMEVSAP